jgi:protein Mpv17
MLRHVNNFMKKRPLLVSVIGNTAKTITADIIAQKVIEKRENIDYRRLGVFGTFGCVYLGGWQYLLFNKVFVRFDNLLKIRRFNKAQVAIALTALDLGVHTPLLYYPSFYTLKGSLEGRSVHESLCMYKNNFVNDILSIWQIWVPMQFLNFLYVPIHLRMPFITCVSLAWTTILSIKRG